MSDRRKAREIFYYMHSKGKNTAETAKYFNMTECKVEELRLKFPDERKAILSDLEGKVA